MPPPYPLPSMSSQHPAARRAEDTNPANEPPALPPSRVPQPPAPSEPPGTRILSIRNLIDTANANRVHRMTSTDASRQPLVHTGHESLRTVQHTNPGLVHPHVRAHGGESSSSSGVPISHVTPVHLPADPEFARLPVQPQDKRTRHESAAVHAPVNPPASFNAQSWSRHHIGQQQQQQQQQHQYSDPKPYSQTDSHALPSTPAFSNTDAPHARRENYAPLLPPPAPPPQFPAETFNLQPAAPSLSRSATSAHVASASDTQLQPSNVVQSSELQQHQPPSHLDVPADTQSQPLHTQRRDGDRSKDASRRYRMRNKRKYEELSCQAALVPALRKQVVDLQQSLVQQTALVRRLQAALQRTPGASANLDIAQDSQLFEPPNTSNTLSNVPNTLTTSAPEAHITSVHVTNPTAATSTEGLLSTSTPSTDNADTRQALHEAAVGLYVTRQFAMYMTRDEEARGTARVSDLVGRMTPEETGFFRQVVSTNSDPSLPTIPVSTTTGASLLFSSSLGIGEDPRLDAATLLRLIGNIDIQKWDVRQGMWFTSAPASQSSAGGFDVDDDSGTTRIPPPLSPQQQSQQQQQQQQAVVPVSPRSASAGSRIRDGRFARLVQSVGECAGARSRGAGPKRCSRCGVLKRTGSGHPRGTCADGLPVSSRIPYKPPDTLS